MTFVLAIVTAGMSAFAGAILCAWLVGSGPAAALVAASCAAFYGATGLSLSRIGLLPGFDLRIIVTLKVLRALIVLFAGYSLSFALLIEFRAVALPFAAGILIASVAEIFLINNKNSTTPVNT